MLHAANSNDDLSATVERALDPRCPGRVVLRITGKTSAAVQLAINGLVNEIDEGGGHGVFFGPRRQLDGSYMAVGKASVGRDV